MFAEFSVRGSSLKSVLADMATLIPSGTKSVPLGVDVSSGVLSLTCNGTCNCEETIRVDTDVSLSVTISYSAIHDYIPSGEDIHLTVQDNGISFKSSKIERFFKTAYSVVSKLNYKLPTMNPIDGQNAVHRLTPLVRTQLANIYKKEMPISTHEGIAMLKYPNIWIQVRLPGFPCSCTFTQDCVRTLVSFGPKKYGIYSNDTIVFTRDNATLFVPMRECTELANVSTLLPENPHVVRMYVSPKADIVKLLKMFDCKTIRVTLVEQGCTMSGACLDGSVTIPMGNSDGEYVCSYELPTELLTLILGFFSDTVAEFLYKEGILCVRNQDTAIAVRVLL